jgi:AcrR family transcriptional regulator
VSKRRRLNRAQVIEQAAALADAAGNVQAVSLTALAAALAIRPPSLYNHVHSLDDLQAGLAGYALEQLLATLSEAARGRVGRDALEAMAHACRQFAHDHPGLYPLSVRAPEPDETDRIALSDELVHLLLLIMASMGLQGEDALHAIRGFRAVLHGFVSLEAAEGYKLALDQDESFRRLVAVYLDGLVATPRA